MDKTADSEHALGAPATTQAVLYLRCSGESQVGGDSFDRQRERCANWARAAGVTVLREYTEAITGTSDSDDRPQFMLMLADIEADARKCREAGADWRPPLIVVEGLDRLARSYGVQESTLMLLMTKGIDVVAANVGENISAAWRGDPTKALLVKILALLAEWEKKMLVARMAAAKIRMRKEGKRTDGRKPYGDPGRFGEAEGLQIMRQIDAHRSLPGRPRITNQDIADCLNALGVPTRGNRRGQKPWHWRVVWSILSREGKGGKRRPS